MKVRIYKPHTHAGKRYAPGPDGIDLDVSPRAAEYLAKHGVTTKPEAAPVAPPLDATPAEPRKQ